MKLWTERATKQKRETLAGYLEQVHQLDQMPQPDYDRRNLLVVRSVALALELGLPAGFRIDAREPDWPVAFIELPTGQVSWHLPQHKEEWDGHDNDAKSHRILKYAEECGLL